MRQHDDSYREKSSSIIRNFLSSDFLFQNVSCVLFKISLHIATSSLQQIFCGQTVDGLNGKQQYRKPRVHWTGLLVGVSVCPCLCRQDHWTFVIDKSAANSCDGI